MQITAATFRDPAYRPQLEQYYATKKSEIYETLKARDVSTLPQEVKMRDADGVEHTAKLIPISAEKMRDALVPFDKWVEFQAENYENQVAQVKQAERSVTYMAKNNPDGLEDAKAHLTTMQEWQKQWQNQLMEIQSFLLGLQEVA